MKVITLGFVVTDPTLDTLQVGTVMFILVVTSVFGVAASVFPPTIRALSPADQATLAASATVSQRTRSLLLRGAEVFDQAGARLGQVAAIDGKFVTITTQQSTFVVPVNAVKGDSGRLVLPMTAAQYDAVASLGSKAAQASAENSGTR